MSVYTVQEALDYHSKVRPGKLEVMPSKPCRTQKDLSLAYSPGVADACNAIAANEHDTYMYTGKGNLVGVVSNGTAVLGLGNIGPHAAKPVMEGKGVLFKVFADIDVFDIEINATDPEKVCEAVKALEPTFGGINLEDIKAPECFFIEETLKASMDIPVFHDDQHGTAIITGAGLMNAMNIAGKELADCTVVISGAGAAAVASARLYKQMGVDPERILMFDTKGHIHQGRTNLTEEKKEFAVKKAYGSIAEAMKGADMFLGLSVKGAITADMVKSMSAKTPVVFACANPDPEITYEEAKAARPDAIVGTGRSDYPNQVNNVLGFPYIFRGALDVAAKAITDGMKIAAARAIADLAKEPVPEYILEAYGLKELRYGVDYALPKALDLRLIETVSPTVAAVAMRENVARTRIDDLTAYGVSLSRRLAASRARMETLLTGYGF
ncbi:Malic protein NAD-binding protein [uncultured delta proteobacterium]|uniref:Malic protein NAD-binding protein n=1 Tax=uncultured delta proteobacterium TaxID=34034 RepID=A0A212J3H5_9DELT|nr:Malic protein NAD-binding protein [uncultured delta proteobacterium]